MDSNATEIGELSSLLKEKLNPKQKFQIERELRAIKNGAGGEENSAYFINFHFEKSKNWAVIHDLRLENEGRSAQIDHILINRLFRFFVLESKNYSGGVKITPQGEFESFYGKKTFGIESPIEQNKRHILFLEDFLKSRDILPRRMGVPIRPEFRSLILIAPKSTISRPPGNGFDTSSVIKADALATKIDEMADENSLLSDLASIRKLSSSETVEEFAKKLVSFHQPKKDDFRAKFGLPAIDDPGNRETEKPSKSTANRPNGSSKYYCAACKKTIPPNVAKYCWENKQRFGGRAYCITCQKTHVRS